MPMMIEVEHDLMEAINEVASREGVSPELLAINALRERFLSNQSAEPATAKDEWERRLLGIASNCGVSLPHSALSRDEIYD